MDDGTCAQYGAWAAPAAPGDAAPPGDAEPAAAGAGAEPVAPPPAAEAAGCDPAGDPLQAVRALRARLAMAAAAVSVRSATDVPSPLPPRWARPMVTLPLTPDA